MGIGPFRSSYSSYDKSVSSGGNVDSPNPDPKNYRIMNFQRIGRFLIIEVNYPDCRNYEGNKILLYKDVLIDDLRNQGSIDPHFSDNKNMYSPIARFVPTNEGRELAVRLAQISITS